MLFPDINNQIDFFRIYIPLFKRIFCRPYRHRNCMIVFSRNRFLSNAHFLDNNIDRNSR